MEHRTHEGHMDWEYQNSGPVDPTSPWAKLARNGAKNESIFATPSKSQSSLSQSQQSQPLSTWGSSPFKSHPPQSSFFTTNLSPRKTAPPLRNPAFTTPRKPFDDPVFSEASGAEDSPAAMTDVSEMTNATPEVDYQGDTNMYATITPSKVNKVQRYRGNGQTGRKHASGKGDIRGPRSPTDIMRKRKRYNLDRDVGSSVRRLDSDSSDAEEDEQHYRAHGQPRHNSDHGRQSGFWRNLLINLQEYENAPDQLWNWFLFAFKVSSVLLFFTTSVWTILSFKNDVWNVMNEEIEGKRRVAFECSQQYRDNQCSADILAPALRPLCDEWNDCMHMDTGSTQKVRAIAKALIEIINETASGVSLKAWGILAGMGAFMVLVNSLPSASRQSSSQSSAPPSSSVVPQRNYHIYTSHPIGYAEDGATDTDGTPPRMILPPSTPSRHRSAYKGSRSGSPVKLSRSPGKRYM